ncbi:MAG: DNA mismatch repair protein MutS, partial [Planctomycetes bacterium]|nr:DNA mismatch repair protein MutS [Planctomycetota bacterium]
KVFGYYIELPAAQARRAPAVFSRRQTLKNAERFITPELKAYEDKVLGASDRMVQREGEMFFALCTLLSGVAKEAGAFAEVCAEVDLSLALADKASQRGWVRPEMVEEPVLEVSQGRHPVLEAILGDGFVPNDLTLGLAREDGDEAVAGRIGGGERSGLALITGPNMGGKSTFIRQAALIALLAHAGSFVPAASAKVGLVDRLFTRIGADDALHAGQSTFMVEMVETARILHHATERSLVILDEIGRGTSTLDGLSLAWAIAEHLSGARGPRTLFATHYHELTEMEERSGGRVVNLHVLVKEWKGEVVFVHRIVPGRASRSYGVHVARLAGLPSSVVERASALLESLSVSHAGGGTAAEDADRRTREKRADSQQLGLFTEFVAHPAVDALRGTDLDSMSPLQAFDALRELKRMVGAPAKA